MWLYSGKGDNGSTNLFDGKKIQKDDVVFELIGTLDEATAYIGQTISFCQDKDLIQDLVKIQDILSKIMGIVAGAGDSVIAGRLNFDELLEWLEKRIHYYGKGLDNPNSFIYAGKTTLGACLDIARTSIRRCERIAVRLLNENTSINPVYLPILNRLSSFFYTVRLFVDQ